MKRNISQTFIYQRWLPRIDFTLLELVLQHSVDDPAGKRTALTSTKTQHMLVLLVTSHQQDQRKVSICPYMGKCSPYVGSMASGTLVK